MLETLLPLALVASIGSIQPFAFAEPIGAHAIRIGLQLADRDARPCATESLGVDPVALGARALFRVHGRISVQLGPRSIGEATVTDVQAFADSAGRCHLVATAALDDRLPLLTRDDVLWASRSPRKRSTRRAPKRGALIDAVRAVREAEPESCTGHHAAVLRGSSNASWVGLDCAEATGRRFRLVRVPRRGAAEVLPLPISAGERLRLLEVLDPDRKTSNLLVLARETAESRTLELWRIRDGRAQRLASGLPVPLAPRQCSPRSCSNVF